MEKLKILIVDDDPFVRAMLGEILESSGYQTKTAVNGVEALEKLDREPDIELIISDMNMDEMNGLELVRTLRSRGQNVPFIVLTVNKEISVALEAIRSGANEYLLKDENIEETIFVSIEKTLEKQQLKKENLELMNRLVIKNKELESRNEELLQLNRHKNKLLGIAAHDIRGPVSAIMGLSEILRDDIKNSVLEEQKQYLEMIIDTSQGILTLINDLLDVSVIESGKLEIKFQSARIDKLIEDRIAIARFAAEKKGISIILNLSPAPEIRADPNRISQVIDNLVSNAVKFSPPDSMIEILLYREDDRIYVGVKDQGPGVSDADREKLFGEFQRLSAQPTGGEKSTGLGLAIVKKVIDAHHGVINVESRPGSGSTFGFYLPI